MKIKISPIILPLAILFCTGSCNQQDNQIVCTMEFRSVIITVNGAPLDQYHTVRESTGDTIRISRSNTPGANDYPVLDDSYQRTLQDRVDTFRFQGWIQNTMTVNERFVIGADKCHIYYVSGNRVVN